MAHVRDDDDVVLGQVQVRLDGVGADLDGAPEGAHGVLGELGLVAPVGYGLGEAVLVEGPRGRGDEAVLGAIRGRHGRLILVAGDAVAIFWLMRVV